MSKYVFLLCVGFLFMLSGCAAPPPTLPKDLKEGVNEIKTGGETICSRGAEYAFFVRKGSVNKVVIDFEGGGACWNKQTCSIADAIFKDNIDNVRKRLQANDLQGIYDVSNPKNPFKDWYHVFIPYCTGDIHWGNNTTTYGTGGDAFQINHKGAVNVRAALKWVYQNFSAPEKVFVTGCSAGAYGSLLWSADIHKQYPNTPLYQMGDSGAGIITDSFLRDSFPVWKAEQAMPTWVTGLDPTKVKVTDHDLAYLYEKIASFHPKLTFSQFNSLYDKTQVTYFNVMGGGDKKAWSQRMLGFMKRIEKSTPNFRTFIASGERHCIIPFDAFYAEKAGDVTLVDWLNNMLNDKPIQSAYCADCKAE